MSVILPAVADDAPALAAVLRDWIHETIWMPKLHSPEQDLWFAAHLISRQVVDVAHGDGAVAGFLARDGGTISCLYLARHARGRGLGARLLERAKAASDTLDLWTFQANHGARRFYARQGFVEAGQTDGAANDEHLPDVRLIWTRGAA